MKRLSPIALVASATLVLGAVGGTVGIGATPAAAVTTAVTSAPLTNLAHLDFLLDDVPVIPGIAGHSTYRQNEEPTAKAPWVYADRLADGSFRRVGGGPITDAARGWYAQGAFDVDDTARAAVVYLRDWKQNGHTTSRDSAYQLLRSLTYAQTDSGPNAGNVILWQQSDGTLNPSAIPVELPDPSDSAESYWLARTVWALGEGYAGFRDADPTFAAFLADRMSLSLGALERQSLAKYPATEVANGVTVPGWLIAGSASPTAEAVLGLSAYATAAPADARVRTALARYASGIAKLASGGIGQWPFGALLPEANSPTLWHAWGGMQPAALTSAAGVLGDASLQKAANADLASFTAQLLASGGADNGWTPTPEDRTQIAYGVDSRVQGLIAASDATNAGGLAVLAGAQAAWYFGANRAGAPAYDQATGVCVDGIAPDGTINRNCGAESAIHTQLTMLALDAHPAVARAATTLTTLTAADGIRTLETETGRLTGSATVVTPPSAWTGSANWSGGKYVAAAAGDSVTIALPTGHTAARILPIVDLGTGGTGSTVWTAQLGRLPILLGTTQNSRSAEQGIGASPTYLRPQTLTVPVPAGATSITARVGGTARSGAAKLDAVLLQPLVSHLGLSSATGGLDVYVNATSLPLPQKLSTTGPVTVTRYNAIGAQVGAPQQIGPRGIVTVEPGGFTAVTPR